MMSDDVVVRVGVTVYRYVSLSNARNWLVHTLKNNRGRGSVPLGEQDAVTFTGDTDTGQPVAATATEQQQSKGEKPDAQNKPTQPNTPPCQEGTGGNQLTGEGSVVVSALPCDEDKRGNQHQTGSVQETASLPCKEADVISTATTAENVPVTADTDVQDGSSRSADAENKTSAPDGQNEKGSLSASAPQSSSLEDTPMDVEEGETTPAGMKLKTETSDTLAPLAENVGSTDPVAGTSQGNTGKDSTTSTQPRRTRRMAAKKWKKQFQAPATVPPVSTYEKIRLHCRLWRRPEGGLNNKLIHECINSILFHLMGKPGTSLMDLTRDYKDLFSPVDMRDLVEILEKLGCVKLMKMTRVPKASLFSKPSSSQASVGLDVVGAAMDELIVEPTVDCSHRLGQFLAYIH
ncbi:general transcription factor 3C polypeptide 1-like [Littorina saxatilis]|uniref:general transcription factor 3C polypeptide 1-like n=1 Tax=Littorina saxatilis TaxID=31220 RepID=UPI0038B47DB7